MTSRSIKVMAALLLAASALAAGCDDDDDRARGANLDLGVAQGLSDAQLAQLLLTANMGEVAKAEAAQPKLADAQAQRFAQRMVSEHGTAITREQALFAQLKISPTPSALSDRLASEANAAVQALQATPPGSGFDLTYMCLQVREHAEVVALLDANAPGARNTQLQAEAHAVRTTAADHLAAAEDITVAIGSRAGSFAATNAGPGKDLGTICAPFGGTGGATVPDGGTTG